MILAAAIQGMGLVGFGLLCLLAGWVCADATRPKVRRTRRTR